MNVIAADAPGPVASYAGPTGPSQWSRSGPRTDGRGQRTQSQAAEWGTVTPSGPGQESAFRSPNRLDMEVPDDRRSLATDDHIACRHVMWVSVVADEPACVCGGSPCAGRRRTNRQRCEPDAHGQRWNEAVGRIVVFGCWHRWPGAPTALVFGQPNDGSVEAQRVVGGHSPSLRDLMPIRSLIAMSGLSECCGECGNPFSIEPDPGTIASVTDDSMALACQWFGVRGEYELLTRRRMAARSAREVALWFVSFGLLMGEFDPKRFGDVIVFRRDTGESVLVYSYDHLGEATDHLLSLRSRLSSMHVFDFCRVLGLTTALVVGSGCGEAEDDGADGAWKGIPTRQRQAGLG